MIKLLKSQKNDLYKAIESSKHYTPSQFEYVEVGEKVSLLHKTTGERFDIREDMPGYWITYEPGFLSSYDSYTIPWEGMEEYIHTWLTNLHRENSVPDLWEELQKNVEIANVSTFQTNTGFTISEYELLKTKIEALSTNINMLPLLAEQQVEIIKQINRVTELAEKLGKFDWTNLFVGTIISIIIQLNVTRENAQAIWDLVRGIFKDYLLH